MCDCHKLTWQSLFNFAGILISARTPNRALVVLQESLRFSEKSKSKHDKSVTLFQIAMVTNNHCTIAQKQYVIIDISSKMTRREFSIFITFSDAYTRLGIR